MNALQSAIFRGAVGLGIFAIVTAGIISMTQLATKDVIVEQKKQARARALFEVIAADQLDNDLVANTLPVPASPLLGVAQPELHIAVKQGEVSGIILPLFTREGYSGPIELLLGINLSGEVHAVRVVNHRETPGLGDRIEVRKSDWIEQFSGTHLDDPRPANWAVAKDGGRFDQLSGATITSRAVIHAVRDGLRYYQQQRESILKQATPAPKAAEGETAHE